MQKIESLFDSRAKILVIISVAIIGWILLIDVASDFMENRLDNDWQDIYKEKTDLEIQTVSSLFTSYQQTLESISDNITWNKSLRQSLTRNETKKVFEEIENLNIGSSYNVEVYNSRLELVAYEGRQLRPDYVILQKALKGQKLSVVKEVGFYTYLIVYSPVREPDEGRVVGVVLTAALVDIQYQIRNRFFQRSGLTSDIEEKLNVQVEVIPANTITGYLFVDSLSMQENSEVDLYGVQKTLIGKILIPKYDKITHSRELAVTAERISSGLIFVLSIIMIFLFIRFLDFTASGLTKLILFALFLILIRYLWLQFGFPSSTFDSEIFSPDYYASKFGFGIVKSIGELIVTSLLLLVYSVYAVSIAYNNYKTTLKEITDSKEKLRWVSFILKFILLLVSFFALFKIFGAVIQSIIFDSNLKFLDNSRIIPSLELFSLQLVLLILSFSFYVLTISIILHLIFRVNGILAGKRFSHFIPFVYLCIFLVVNQILETFEFDFGVSYWYRVAIIILVFAFGYYVTRMSQKDITYSFYSLKNLSFILLLCIITIPIITLDNITSQETKFVEILGDKLSENQEERINFTLNSELVTLSENREIEDNIRDKNKLPRLAFYLWADSKLNTENFNSTVIVLDTNKDVVSDFNINESKLNTDSVLSFLKINFFDKGYIVRPGEIMHYEKQSLDSLSTENEGEFEEEEEYSKDEGNEPFIYDNIAVLKDDLSKFFVGIVPIQKLDLRNTRFARVIGYLVIGISYESRNFLLQSSLDIFKSYTKDNLLDKLISRPVFTEYINGKVASTTNKDLAVSGLSSLNIFKEYIKNSENNSEWRIENFNNEKYRSYYIMAETGNNEEGIYERIYSISLKRDDLRVTVFYYLKFIIFSVFVYVVLYLGFGIYYIVKHRRFWLNFREKLFFSFFLVSVIPIILLAIYTRGFIISKNDSNLQNQIISDLNILSESLKGKQIIDETVSDPDSLRLLQRDFLKGNLSRTDKNFNLYIKNKLISTTNEELYKSDLLDTRVDAEANYNINFLNKDLFLKTQNQGTISYLVAYKPYKDPKNNIVGIISSQLVYKQSEINEELTETLTFIFGIYFIVIIISLILVSFLTDRISKPILELQKATEKLSRGQSGIQLKISSKDELQGLVVSFNKMTKELERSKRELKKAEREAAWRDIARRVAHEIKNPLTPMKLSIQHLVNVYKDNGKSEFPVVLEKTKMLIINEIDKLNRIATEFSNFAKLPRRNYQPLDLNKIMMEVISLYKNHPNIKFNTELDQHIPKVLADREEMNRVFQNIIKNSVQAIEGDGMISVVSYLKKNHIYFEIEDNGIGMDKNVLENLFEPNFSTKSSGMGLGLAISKKSIDDMKAKISYESSPGSGTKVILRFNIYKQ
ncbi:MAG: HAMP domain-containing protein [Ignavibacteriae bacterium]|nr:HAMP domain-containing protein [Ignavibacteriota bacterium]MCB9242654.1 HAMP domain-containing protein [Ignavibacteriales bacterium]